MKSTLPSAALLNNENLSFTSLFLLRKEIEKSDIYRSLNTRNKIALQFTKEILDETSVFPPEQSQPLDYIQKAHYVLRWMLKTGAADDGLNDDFDRLLDISAVLLTREYHDKSILPHIADIVFSRSRKKHFFHDMLWAFWEIQDPRSLSLFAEKLLSEEPADCALAQQLIYFIPHMQQFRNSDRYEQYRCCLDWLEENMEFLYFTGQGYQQTSNPSPYAVALPAKYLHKNISEYFKNEYNRLTEKDHMLLSQFEKLDSDTKRLLADFSFKLYNKNKNSWSAWLDCPLNEQIRYALSGGAL